MSLRRTNQEEGAAWTGARIGPRGELIALHIRHRLNQFLVQFLFFFLFQRDLEGLARAHVVEAQLD